MCVLTILLSDYDVVTEVYVHITFPEHRTSSKCCCEDATWDADILPPRDCLPVLAHLIPASFQRASLEAAGDGPRTWDPNTNVAERM